MSFPPRWPLFLPACLFALAVFVSRQSEHGAGAQFDRSHQLWLAANYTEAIQAYEEVQRAYPQSQYADNALWEIAEIYYTQYYNSEKAQTQLEKLLFQYPDSSLVPGALLRLGEIHEARGYDPASAVKYWELFLARDPPNERQRQILFKKGRMLIKMELLDEAERDLEEAANGKSDHLAERAYVCLGTIAQIRGEHHNAIKIFGKARSLGRCGECLLQCRLSMIESFEFTGELDRAMSVAHDLGETGYPKAQRLAERLLKKSEFYGR